MEKLKLYFKILVGIVVTSYVAGGLVVTRISQVDAMEATVSTHEQRLDTQERGLSRIEGKLDTIMDFMGVPKKHRGN